MPIRTVRRKRVLSPEPARQTRTVWPTWPTVGREAWALLPLSCVLLGGTTERWSQAVMLLALGAGWLFAPPRSGPGRRLTGIAGALLLLSLTAFLPVGWFRETAWRSALTGDFAVMLPGTLSPQPWFSAESLIVFAAGLTWAGAMIGARWTDEERPRANAWYAGGVVALAVACVGLYRAGIVPAIWTSERGFGPFPNRNQTADFFAISALPVLACARAAWRAGRKPAAFGWLAGWLAVAGAVFHSLSRAGLAILFTTTAVYLVLETLHRTRHQPEGSLVRWRRLAMVFSLVLALGSGLLLFGGETLTRVRWGGALSASNTLSNELRQSIYADTFRLVNASPWCGNGLDTFNEVFPTYRREAVQNTLDVRHPESDWLWLAAELGWPGAALMLVGTGLVVHRLRLPRHGQNRPLRLAATLGVAGFIVHSLVDVSAHRVGSVFAALFLLSLALPGEKAAEPVPTVDEPDAVPRRPVRGGRVLGGVFLLVGSLWILVSSGWLLLPGESGVQRLRVEALSRLNHRDEAGAIRLLNRALAWAPLDWQGYYLRGAAEVRAGRLTEEALVDFRRARYLNPFNPRVPRDEALVWAAAGQTGLAVGALMEACRRDPADAERLILPVYLSMRRDETFALGFGAAVRRDPTLTIAFLRVLEAADALAFITQVLQDNPELQGMDGAQKTTFFHLWAQRGEPGALAEAMTAHPAWQGLGWRWWAEAVARDGTADALATACGIVERFVPSPNLPPERSDNRPQAEWKTAAENASFEPAAALPYYRAQVAAGNQVGALATLQRAVQATDCPAYFYFLEARTAGKLGQWPVAWSAWRRYLQLTKANE